MNKITVLVNSCDKYEDAWDPFFELLHIYGGSFPYPIVLNTERKQYSSKWFKVRTVNTPKKCSWSKRLLHVLDQIDTEYIFFLLDDYFLEMPFDHDRFARVIDYMDSHPEAGCCDIAPRYADTPEDAIKIREEYRDFEDCFVERSLPKYNINCAPYVWRTVILKKLLRKSEDVWEFEDNAGYRAKYADIKVIRYYMHYPSIYEYNFRIWSGIGITRGQWLPGNKAFFERHGIHVNFERLGFLDLSSLKESDRNNNLHSFLQKARRVIKRDLYKKGILR